MPNFIKLNCVIFVHGSFDGESLKVAELLYKNGFKEVYSIKGGVRGKDGWLVGLFTFLPSLLSHKF
jgi:hypothetical protein